jgi:hypothetical protein
MKRLVLVILLVFSIGLPVLAQDEPTEASTPAPTLADTPETPPIVVEDGGTVIVNPEDETDDPASINIGALLGLVAGVLVAIAAGGGFAVVWERIRKDKQVKDNAELLFNGLSPEWKDVIKIAVQGGERVAQIALELSQFLKEATDGLPNNVEVEAQARSAARDEVARIRAEETPPTQPEG